MDAIDFFLSLGVVIVFVGAFAGLLMAIDRWRA